MGIYDVSFEDEEVVNTRLSISSSETRLLLPLPFVAISRHSVVMLSCCHAIVLLLLFSTTALISFSLVFYPQAEKEFITEEEALLKDTDREEYDAEGT